MSLKPQASIRAVLVAVVLAICCVFTVASLAAQTYDIYYEVEYVTDNRPDLHYATQIFGRGEYVELEDGSRYNISYGDTWRVRRWAVGDPIFITPKKTYFFGLLNSSADICLYNSNTQETVEADISEGPFLFGPYSYWIASVDWFKRKIVLANGLRLKAHSSDEYAMWDWEPNEHVLIGTNDRSDVDKYPFYVINVSRLEGIRARIY